MARAPGRGEAAASSALSLRKEARRYGQYVQALLQRERLYREDATVVFADFDAGLGGGMALTTINDENTARRECPRSHGGKSPWWCGKSEDAHWGGILHEVGHMLGLRHPESSRSIMGAHWRFLRDPAVGLLPGEAESLSRRFRTEADPAEDSPHLEAGSAPR